MKKLLFFTVFAVVFVMLGFSLYSFAMEYNTNRGGSDYKNFDLQAANPLLCKQACDNDAQCKAYTYVKPGHQGANARCWLKDAVPTASDDECCISGVKGAVSPLVSFEQVQQNTNRPGSDYKHFDIEAAEPDICKEFCRSDSNCKAYTYVKPGIQGFRPQCWLKDAVPAPKSDQCCVSGVKKITTPPLLPAGMELNTNRPGSDYKNFDLSSADPQLCQQECYNDAQCKAYTYVKPGYQGANARCWLKNAVPNPQTDDCCISGVKKPSILPIIPISMEQNTNRPGSDYKNYDLNNADPKLCQQDCKNDPNCKAYTYVKPGVQGIRARCWLKNAVPNAKTDDCCVSGVKGFNLLPKP